MSEFATGDGVNTKDATLLSVRQLRTWFELRRWGLLKVGDVRAVDGLDFEMRRGEAVAFVGESGCGKSSLARTLLGLYRPTAGSIWIEGEDMAGFDRHQLHLYRRKIGYVQQDPYAALPPFMQVRRILREPLIVHGNRDREDQERKIRAALREVRLEPPETYLTKFPHMLSGGQQQRVVIARALILKPALIIADEPVSMLDASVRVEILNLLRQIQQQRNLTLAFITHDLSTVRYFANRIMVMYAGQIVERAPVDTLLDQPRHPYTQALLEALPDPDPDNAQKIRRLPKGEPPSLVSPPSGCRFHPRCPHAIKGLCEIKPPPEFPIAPEHGAACWLNQPS